MRFLFYNGSKTNIFKFYFCLLLSQIPKDVVIIIIILLHGLLRNICICLMLCKLFSFVFICIASFFFLFVVVVIFVFGFSFMSVFKLVKHL